VENEIEKGFMKGVYDGKKSRTCI